MKKIGIIALILAPMFGIFIWQSPAITDAISASLMKKLAENGVETTAVVTNQKITIGVGVREVGENEFEVDLNLFGADDEYGEIHYQFRDENGKLRSGLSSVEQDVYEKYKVGEPITIIYFSRFPSFNMAKDRLPKSP